MLNKGKFKTSAMSDHKFKNATIQMETFRAVNLNLKKEKFKSRAIFRRKFKNAAIQDV
jgi:hypothetical protein